MGGFFNRPAPPAASGIPNATLYWASVLPTNPAPFTILFGDGKITGAMWSFIGGGQYVLDMSSLLTSGIFAVFVTGFTPFNDGGGDTFALANSTLSGDWVAGTKTVGFQFYRWNGSAFALAGRRFSVMLLAT